MAHTPHKLLFPLLKDVSRSFYITLRLLPREIRVPIGLAYLLARTTDTIVDTEAVPLERRFQALRDYRERVFGLSTATVDFGDLARSQGSQSERKLLEKCEAGLAMVRALQPNDLQRVLDVFNTIVSGQEMDLRRFAGATSERIVALRHAEELDDYAYRVAGCVGEFWTHTCMAKLYAGESLDKAFFLANGVRFGKGLQLVNILRDMPADLRHGRCYLPEEGLKTYKLTPQDLLQPENEVRLRPLYGTYLDVAEKHLEAGWTYTVALPRRSARVRIACAIPILIGLKTIALLRKGPVLDPNQRIRVKRSEVRALFLKAVLLHPLQDSWNDLPRHCTY